MKWSGLPVVIFGSGGISKETFFIIPEINNNNNVQVYNFLGFVEDHESKIGNEIINGYKVIACDNNFCEYAKNFAELGVVIPIGTPKVKSIIFNKLDKIGNIVFPNIIHPNVKYDKNSVIFGYGNVIAAGTNFTCNIKVGNFNLININTSIGHDANIGNFNVINPLAAISGDVNIKDLCLVGTGANILQQLTVNEGAIVGAGSVVVKDVEKFTTVLGIPARNKF